MEEAGGGAGHEGGQSSKGQVVVLSQLGGGAVGLEPVGSLERDWSKSGRERRARGLCGLLRWWFGGLD